MNTRVKTKKEAIFWNKENYNGDFGNEYDKDHIMDFDSYIYKEIEKDIEKFKIDKNKKLRILDIGCGSGNLTTFFMKHFPKAEFYCLDISKNMLDKLEEKISNDDKNRVKFIEEDALEFLKKEENKFDIIMASGAYHHLFDYIEVIKESLSRIEKDGIFYIANESYKSNGTNALKKYLLKILRIQDSELYQIKKSEKIKIKNVIYLIYSFFHLIQPIVSRIKNTKIDDKFYYSEVHDYLDLEEIKKLLIHNNFEIDMKEGLDFQNQIYYNLACYLGVNDHFRLIGGKNG